MHDATPKLPTTPGDWANICAHCDGTIVTDRYSVGEWFHANHSDAISAEDAAAIVRATDEPAPDERICLKCAQPVYAHHVISAQDIGGSAGATISAPRRISNGAPVYAPLSPLTVGDYFSHRPLVKRA